MKITVGVEADLCRALAAVADKLLKHEPTTPADWRQVAGHLRRAALHADRVAQQLDAQEPKP